MTVELWARQIIEKKPNRKMCRLADVSVLPRCVRSPYNGIQGRVWGLVLHLPTPLLGRGRLETTARCIIYQDFAHEYRWRLRSSDGATISLSERGYYEKSGCARELEQLGLEYPDAFVRDATVRGFEEQLLSQWLASQAS